MPDAAKIPVEERLFSLVLALLASKAGLTKSEILSTVQGYRQRFSATGDNASLERQFERDKDDIRELGVPLETVPSPDDPGNNQSLRYRIPRGAYELPEDVSFSPEEMAILSLAGAVWREGSLSAESRRATMKLRSLGVDPESPILGYTPRLRVAESAFEPLGDALERRMIVTFPYLKPGEAAPRQRTVAPLAIVQHQSRWHLYGIDQDAGAERTFLLSRIAGGVRVTNRRFEADDADFAALALDELDELWSANVAEVRVVPDSDAATRLNNRFGGMPPGNATVRMHYTDANVLADELAGYGPEVFVVAPDRLRRLVRDRLRTVAAAHSDGGVT